ncbi:MAG: Crp/Fnr family transcriptional regulator [Sphingomonadales bacterium]|jgi:CRP-like cAMP-binding protein|nr:Crp/Fnr family transcriptional regulator [Sphingomonadales bacterium]
MDRLEDLIATLAPDTLLRALAPDQLETLLRDASARDLKPGEAIITQGDEDGGFAVVVLTGGLKITMISASGHEIILNYCGPGELVGEIAMLDSGPRTATVTAAVPSRVLLLPSRTFLAAATGNPVSAAGVMRELARRVRQLNMVIESDRTFSMAPRLALALVRLIDPDKDDGRLRFDLNQNELGAFAGLARENVSRLLSEWEAQGIITRHGRALRIRDRDYLQTLAEFGDDA